MRQAIRGAVRLKHLDRQGRFKSGNPRCYFRIGQGRRIPLPDLPMDHPDWLAAYAAAAQGQRPQERRPEAGTIAAGVVAYLRSEDFHGLSDGTRGNRRRAADDIRKRYGKAKLADLEARHIRADLAPMSPNPANNRLKVWRALCRYWSEIGLIETDPARDVRPRKAPKSDGHAAWERADLDLFRARWPIGSPQRLAMELIYRTAAAIGDACTLGPRNVKDGWLTYTRAKSETACVCPWTVPAPNWFEANDDLHRCLATASAALSFLAVPNGRPRSPKAATQWFSHACREAGLDAGKTAHGLRKLRSAMMRENGATEEQRMAILGHETTTEARRYSKSASLARIITGTENSQLTGQNSQKGA